jgi:DNA-binding Lrp family transcriptional regulator
MQNLIQSGTIKRFTIEARDERPKALVLISVAPSTPTSQVAEQIAYIGRVESLFEVAGPYDITITISGEDITSINQIIEEIRSLKGVQQTNTLFVLKDWLKLAT